MQNQRSQITFFRELRVYQASFAFREDIQKGDKILLPGSALGELYPLMTRTNKDPLIFCIKNGSRHTYTGVLEFVAEEGLCYIPNWMFKMLKFKESGETATVTLVHDLRKRGVQYTLKLRPHLTEFINLQNPKAILEYQLRNFTCLHQGDTITIPFQKDKYEIDIISILPKTDYSAICIIEADVNVEFEAPLDYVQPPKDYGHKQEVDKEDGKKGPFSGMGVRIDEKTNLNVRKGSAVLQIPDEEQYDPRKHRIHRGVRKTSMDWCGTGVKISNAVGTKK